MNKKISQLLLSSIFIASSFVSINSYAQERNVGLVVNVPAEQQTAKDKFDPKNNPDFSSESATKLYHLNKQILNKIVLNTTSFAQGPYQDDSKTLYVFFDPQCEQCGALWKNLQQDKFKTYRILWIPVSVVNSQNNTELGLKQAATIIASPDPLKAFAEHEKLLSEGKMGITPKENLASDIIDRIRANTYIYNHQGFERVPALFHVKKNGQLENYQGEAVLMDNDLLQFIEN